MSELQPNVEGLKPPTTLKEEPTYNFPVETVELPSKGLVYPESSPLSEGKIIMKYMTAKEEDIITNQNYISKGTAIDHLLQALIVTPGVKESDLIVGDKNAILIAARVLGYGANYKFEYMGDQVEVDLSSLENKEIDYSLLEGRTNEFEFTLPHTQTPITFRILTGKIEQAINSELKGQAKINKNASKEMSTRMMYLIMSVNGDSERKTVRDFVNNSLLARDAKALRDHIAKFQPDVAMKFDWEDYDGTLVEREIPITSGFFSLTPSEARDYRVNLFSQIHDIIFHGNGGFDYMTVYNMPLWLRKFTFNKINAYFAEQNKEKSGTTTNDLNEARSILQKAGRQGSPSPQQSKSSKPSVKVPDFVTSTRKTS